MGGFPAYRGRLRRAGMWANLGVFVISLAAIAWSVAFFAHRPALRAQIDSTKTRAYSLSEQTQRLVGDLDGAWRIALVYVPQEIDRAALRQMEEVLDRFDASEHITVEKIDPTDPGSIAAYEQLLERLRGIYAEEIGNYEHHLEQALEAYSTFATDAAREAALAAAALRGINEANPMAGSIRSAQSFFGSRATNAGAHIAQAEDALKFSEARPIPDYEMARDVLHAALSMTASELHKLARAFETGAAASGVDPQIRAYLVQARVRLNEQAMTLQKMADPLLHLRPLELTDIGHELQRGEAAVIISPGSAGVIPATQLLPRGNLRTTSEGGITFDQRFRGEQLIASAMRSMVVDQMPMVIFVHAQGESMLAPRIPNRFDLVGVASTLKAGRFDVAEWSVVDAQPPQAQPGQPMVWVIVPPPFAERKLEMPREERVLLDTARSLIADGQAVLLPIQPSIMHSFNQPDPWQDLARELGVEADTSRILTQRAVGADGEASLLRSAQIVDPEADHVIAEAIHGQQMFLQLPIPLQRASAGEAEGDIEPLIIVDPDPEYWLDPDWSRTSDPDREVPVEQRLREPLMFAVAVSRESPRGGTDPQRLIVMGSADWMLTAIAEPVADLGGGRVALLNPGNIEFMQAAAAWLAGMDQLIAASPTSRQVARIEGLSDVERTVWRWGLVAALPLLCLFFGAGVWFVRK